MWISLDVNLTQATDNILGSPTLSFRPPLLLVGPPSNQCQATDLEVTLASSLSLTWYTVLALSSQNMSYDHFSPLSLPPAPKYWSSISSDFMTLNLLKGFMALLINK